MAQPEPMQPVHPAEAGRQSRSSTVGRGQSLVQVRVAPWQLVVATAQRGWFCW